MIDVLKFRDKAEYADRRQGYMLDGSAVSPIIQKFGGKLVFSASLPM